MNKEAVLTQLRDRAEEIRRRFSVKALWVFGSIVRGEAADKSDVDLLVTFDQRANFDTFMDLKFYLVLCRRPIDGCHCERSEAISILQRPEIATSAFGGLAMTTPQIKSDRTLVPFLKRNCHFLSFPRKRESSLSGYGFRIKCGMTH